jgi:ankyrin repeat protein
MELRGRRGSETDPLMLQFLRSVHDTRVLPEDIDIDCVNDEGKTPLLMAVMNNQEECVKILLENSADIHKRDH